MRQAHSVFDLVSVNKKPDKSAPATFVWFWRLRIAGGAFSCLLPVAQLLAHVFERHDGVAKCHAGSRVAHDGLDANLRLATLAMRLAVLAVAFMAVWARGSTVKRPLDGFAALGAHAGGIPFCRVMIASAIDVPNGLERTSVFIEFLHAPSIDDAQALLSWARCLARWRWRAKMPGPDQRGTEPCVSS